jgi:ATP-dependent Clp protease ATP-binding subunit ClpX
LNRQAVGYSTSKNVDNIDKENFAIHYSKDIKDFGLIPEIIGRLPVLTYGSIRQRNPKSDFDTA